MGSIERMGQPKKARDPCVHSRSTYGSRLPSATTRAVQVAVRLTEGNGIRASHKRLGFSLGGVHKLCNVT